MHTSRYIGAAILALTLSTVLSTACNKSAGTGGTTATPTGVRVAHIDLGRSLTAEKTIGGTTDSFKPNDTIYASVATEGAAPSTTLKARWTFQDGQVVNESSQTIAPTGAARTEFHISKPDGWPAGKYKIEVLVNGVSAGSKDFAVAP